MFNLRETVLYILAATALVTAGCTGPGFSTDLELVRFTSSAGGYVVKSTDVTLSSQDEVGIFARDPIGAGNVRGVVSGKSIFPDEKLYWIEGQTTATVFSAYSPYSSRMTGEIFPFSVADDQRQYAGYAASDLRTSSRTVLPGNVVDFVFEHRLSKIILGVDPGKRTVSGVSVDDVFRSGIVNMESGEVSGISGLGSVRAGLAAASAESRVYVAIFMPQTVKAGVVITADDKEYHFVLETPQEFLPGFAYYAFLKLDDAAGAGSAVGFSVVVTDWDAGGPLDFSREQ